MFISSKLSVFSLLVISLSFAATPKPGGLDNALDISRSGVIAQRTKMNIIAENIANIDTTKTETGLPYRRKQAVLRQVEYFYRNYRKNMLGGVAVDQIKEDTRNPFKKVYDPNHPDADKAGFVYYPNIDLTKELIQLSNTNGSYEANVVVFNTTKQMMQSSLEIGR